MGPRLGLGRPGPPAGPPARASASFEAESDVEPFERLDSGASGLLLEAIR